MIQVPPEVITFVTFVVTAFVVQGEKEIAAWFGIDISGDTTKIVAAVMLVILNYANYWLALVPAQYAPLVQSLFAIVVAILGMYGVARTFVKKTEVTK